MTKRVLIYRIGSLGDTIVSLPSIHLVARVFPNAERRLLTNFPIKQAAPPAAAILENTGLVQGYFRYSIGTRSPLELLRLWWSIASWRPDVLVYLGTARGLAAAKRDRTFFRLCGVKQIVGVPSSEEEQGNLLLADGETLEPEAERLARLIADLGDANVADPSSWDLRLTAEERARAAEALKPAGGRPLVAVSIGTKVQSNEWGNDNWRALLARIATEYPRHALAVIGAPGDIEASEYIAASWRGVGAGPALNLCGQLKPRESGALLAQASLFLGHDSGPMHLAAAVQTPCVAVFSARGKPRVWFPYGEQHRVLYHRVDCWGCSLDTCIVEKKKCILSISVDEVFTQVRSVLG
jgi:ADP-heptose:LPS heptosyltransferase